MTKGKRKTVSAGLTSDEMKKLKIVQRFVRQMSGEKSRSEAIRFLIRNWETP